MKYLLRFILITAVICIGIIFTQSSAFMQKNNDKKISNVDIEDCIKVTLITNSDKHELKKDNPISVIVRIDNNSDRKVKLRHEPVFNFERIGIKPEDKTKLIFGDYYTGRIASKNSSNSRNVVLEKGEYSEFVVNIAELELKDVKSSINVWGNIFQELEKGEYSMNAEAVIDFSNDEKDDSKQFLSNKIIISSIIGVKN